MKDGYMLFGYDRKRTSTLTLDSQPGAHTGATRKYIPGYSSANIVYLDTAAGNDAWTGANPTNSPAGTGPFLTYSAAATAASTTKKIRLVNSATLTANITKPTEATIGTTSTINAATTGLDVFTLSGTPSFGSTTITSVCYSDRLARWVAVGGSGKAAYSNDNGTTWTQASVLPTSSLLTSVIYVDALRLFIATGGSGNISYSTNGTSWTTVNIPLSGGRQFYSVAYSPDLELLVAVGGAGMIFTSTDGITWSVVTGWEQASGTIGTTIIIGVFWSDYYNKFYICGDSRIMYSSTDGLIWSALTSSFSSTAINAITGNGSRLVAVAYSGKIAFSTDGTTWTQAATPSFGADTVFGVTYNGQFGKFCAVGDAGKIAWSTDGDTWTQTGTTGYGASQVRGAFGRFGKVIAVGEGGKIGLSNAPGLTISAAVAGFSINEATYSGTVTAYNCTLKQPGTTAALSLDSCRVTESGSHISNNAVTSTATLYEGDRHTTCTPASQNAIDMNLDTVGGTWYIYNASQTGYERIRDCLVEGGIVASYNVTVSGRANVRGTSANVLFGATVTFRDPKFIDTTDYKLQFQSNGYARNSLAAGRSALYFNSAGDARDIGAWSYVESNVTYYFAKNVYIPKGEITHSVEEVVSEQQGDSGAVSVYGNVNRIKEVITIKYTTEKEADLNVVRAMRLLTDKTVLIQLDPEWDANPGSVVANGAHSVGDDVLNIDATATYNGLTVTIAGKKYYPLRMEPNATATTRLILDRPLEDSVADNDVITRNYPTGAGEYQYSAQQRLDLARVDATVMRAYRTGFIIRLVRAYQ